MQMLNRYIFYRYSDVWNWLNVESIIHQNRTVSINPNVISFWDTKSSHKIVYNGKVALVSPNMARDYMGTELNLIIKSEIIKDLTIFGKFAVFFPGGYFKILRVFHWK